MTPRLQVVAAGSPREVPIELRATRLGPGGESEPYAGAVFEALVEEGRGRPSPAIVAADDRGIVSLEVAMPGESDRTRIALVLERDSRSWLPFHVVSAPVVPVELEAGEIRQLDVPRDGAILRLADGATEHILVPHQTDTDRSGAAYRFVHRADAEAASGGSATAGPAPAGAWTGGRAAPPRKDLDPRGLAPAAEIADAINIRSCGIRTSRMAPLRYLGTHIALYVDAPRTEHQARIDSLGTAFDRDIHPRNTRLFGPTTDLDGNGRVLVVLSPALDENGGLYCDSVRTIGVEAFYGTWDPEDPIDRPLGTLAHEHQHVINAGHHLARDVIGDERWLNEGLSYAAEALNGYWGGALTHLWRFLVGQNSGLSALPLEFSSAGAGGYMLFLLYLRDRFGEDTFLALGGSGKAGRENVEAVTGERFEDLLRDWFIANAVSNRGLTDDPRYSYRSVSLHEMEAELAGCRCLPMQRFDGALMESLRLGRSFDVWRRLDRADADYYRLVGSGGEGGVAEVFYDASGRQTTRLAIVRSR